ncbi:MAG: 5-carboxymethyl-2-hydroxymuconate Delta-isomerase [Rhodospirillum sp.]|nr:5-carboxymethyl-2-hydroxymuconate Delta-isomerase [Rhodospirillum sp.]MCF8500574.1 5-carboxymethyl-2-hydroxymuconate Delta-isomerase [Rhodospirillum sp.]
MPHFVMEYTDNLDGETDIKAVLRKVNQILIDQGGVFPIGGIRSRAIRLTDYVMADGEEDYAFVHCSLKVGAGRTPEQKKAACDALFAMIKDHFAEIQARRYLALSLEFAEFDEAGTWKSNNVHAKFKTS